MPTAQEVIDQFRQLSWRDQRNVLDTVIPMDEEGVRCALKTIWESFGAKFLFKFLGADGTKSLLTMLKKDDQADLVEQLLNAFEITVVYDKDSRQAWDNTPATAVIFRDHDGSEMKPPFEIDLGAKWKIEIGKDDPAWLNLTEAAAILKKSKGDVSKYWEKWKLETGTDSAGHRWFRLRSVRECRGNLRRKQLENKRMKQKAGRKSK